jgi:hypothetical protein
VGQRGTLRAEDCFFLQKRKRKSLVGKRIFLYTTAHNQQRRQYKGKGHPITGNQGPRGGSRGRPLLILNLGARRGWVVTTTPR